MTEKHDTTLECVNFILALSEHLNDRSVLEIRLGPKACQQIRELAGKITEGEKP